MEPSFAFIHSYVHSHTYTIDPGQSPITTHTPIIRNQQFPLPPKSQRIQDAGRSSNGDVRRLALNKQLLDGAAIDHGDKALAASIAEQAAGIKVEPERLDVLA